MGSNEYLARRIQERAAQLLTREVDMSDIAVRVRAGIDVGNATTIACVQVEDDAPAIVKMPTQKTLRGARNIPATRKDDHILAYQADGLYRPRYVGTLAVEASEGGASESARGSRARYADGWSVDFILAALCAGAPGVANMRAEIALGVPAELYTSAHASDIATAIVETYEFRYNGQDRRVKIDSVSVEREGYAALSSLEEMPSGRVLVLDIGGGTINVVSVLDGACKGVKTLHNTGIEYMLDDVDRMLVDNKERVLSLAERRGLLDALRDKEDYSITIANKDRQINEIAKALIEPAVKDFVSVLASKVDTSVYKKIYLVGGGARAGLWGDKLKEYLPKAERMSDAPEEDNARGLLSRAGGKGSIKRAKGRK